MDVYLICVGLPAIIIAVWVILRTQIKSEDGNKGEDLLTE